MEENIEEIKNLSALVFNDADYMKVMDLLNYDKLNELRQFVSEKLELHERLLPLRDNKELANFTIQKLNRLEDVVFDYYLEKQQ